MSPGGGLVDVVARVGFVLWVLRISLPSQGSASLCGFVLLLSFQSNSLPFLLKKDTADITCCDLQQFLKVVSKY
jgi:hypothetical protein